MGPAAVSSSGKAVYEDEMGPAEGSATKQADSEPERALKRCSVTRTPTFVPEMGCRWGRSVPESVKWSVPELVEGPTHARHSGPDLPHSGLAPESPPRHFARAKRVVTSARRSAKQPHRNAYSVRCAHGCGAPSADIGLWRT